MPSVKQLQSRLINKKRDMNKVNLNLATARKDVNDVTLKRLEQNKVSLDRDIQKLDRQLVMEKRTCMEKVKSDLLRLEE